MTSADLEEFIEVLFPVRERPDWAGMRVDTFLVQRLQTKSRALIQRFISEGRVLLRGRKAKASMRVDLDDTVVVLYPPRNEPPPSHDRLTIVYEDERMLVVNKPGNLLSHPTGKISRNTATAILGAQFPDARLHLVHRLDRETSGLLLFARDPEAASFLGRQFEDRKVSKQYLAIVRGVLDFQTRLVDAPIGFEGKIIRLRQAVDVAGAQPAATEIERVAAGRSCSLVRVLPRTGRLHQIRVHLALIGHPILGDKLYQAEGRFFLKLIERDLRESEFEVLGARRQMLHAWRLEIGHPGTGKSIRFEAPPPQDFMDVLNKEGLEPRY